MKGRHSPESLGGNWVELNEKSLGTIASALVDDFIHHITGITNAKEAWDELETIFGTKTKHSKVKLLMQLYSLKLKPNDDMLSHINKFKSIRQQLISIDKKLEDDEARAILQPVVMSKAIVT